MTFFSLTVACVRSRVISASNADMITTREGAFVSCAETVKTSRNQMSKRAFMRNPPTDSGANGKIFQLPSPFHSCYPLHSHGKILARFSQEAPHHAQRHQPGSPRHPRLGRPRQKIRRPGGN